MPRAARGGRCCCAGPQHNLKAGSALLPASKQAKKNNQKLLEGQTSRCWDQQGERHNKTLQGE